MLLAEIHGKRCSETDGNEDLLTSAVFGHLRFVPPRYFWQQLFAHARTAGAPGTFLSDMLLADGVRISAYSKLEIEFWRNCGDFGEPDLLLKFTGDGLCPIVVVIEVKLNSGKSSTGPDDQLKKYLELLDGPELRQWRSDSKHRFVVFLTPVSVQSELEDSIAECKWTDDARNRIFGLEWSQVVYAAQLGCYSAKTAGDVWTEVLLGEVVRFLAQRGFEAFKGFAWNEQIPKFSKGFYSCNYFRLNRSTSAAVTISGAFYGN